MIYRSWAGNQLMGTLAVANTVAVIVALVAMGINAVRILRTK